MIRATYAFVLGALVAGAACGRDKSRPADTTLSNDLSLAAQQHSPYDSLSPAERSALASPASATPTHTTSHASTTTSSGTHVHHTSAGTRTASSGSGGTVSSSSGGTVVKHTQRDAAIGAAAGAVIGATSSRNKVKGGIIGAAVGGILGGVFGNNVDKKKVP